MDQQTTTIQGILRDALAKIYSEFNVRVTDMNCQWGENLTPPTDGSTLQYRVRYIRYRSEANFK